MPIYYKTTVTLKFNKHLTNKGTVVCTRTETVTATGNTIEEAENAALLKSAFYITTDPNEKIIFELQTIRIKSSRIF